MGHDEQVRASSAEWVPQDFDDFGGSLVNVVKLSNNKGPALHSLGVLSDRLWQHDNDDLFITDDCKKLSILVGDESPDIKVDILYFEDLCPSPQSNKARRMVNDKQALFKAKSGSCRKQQRDRPP